MVRRIHNLRVSHSERLTGQTVNETQPIEDEIDPNGNEVIQFPNNNNVKQFIRYTNGSITTIERPNGQLLDLRTNLLFNRSDGPPFISINHATRLVSQSSRVNEHPPPCSPAELPGILPHSGFSRYPFDPHVFTKQIVGINDIFVIAVYNEELMSFFEPEAQQLHKIERNPEYHDEANAIIDGNDLSISTQPTPEEPDPNGDEVIQFMRTR